MKLKKQTDDNRQAKIKQAELVAAEKEKEFYFLASLTELRVAYIEQSVIRGYSVFRIAEEQFPTTKEMIYFLNESSQAINDKNYYFYLP